MIESLTEARKQLTEWGRDLRQVKGERRKVSD